MDGRGLRYSARGAARNAATRIPESTKARSRHEPAQRRLRDLGRDGVAARKLQVVNVIPGLLDHGYDASAALIDRQHLVPCAVRHEETRSARSVPWRGEARR